jgi:rhodanese-related sulfurtransferase
MTRTVPAPKTQKLVISAVDYFSAKLAYEMTPWALKNLLEKTPEAIVLLDVRPVEMFAAAHLPHAINIPLTDLISKLNTLPKNKTIVTYCGSLTCALAPKAALELAQKGFQVQELVGGIAMWQEKGFPVEKKA